MDIFKEPITRFAVHIIIYFSKKVIAKNIFIIFKDEFKAK